MSKIITLTDEMRNQCLSEFAEALDKMNNLDEGKLTFSKSFLKKDEKATIVYTSKAWIKLTQILDKFDKEVGWHGLIQRNPNNDNEFIIYDIVIYPQTVTAATVNTDQEKYQMWLMS